MASDTQKTVRNVKADKAESRAVFDIGSEDVDRQARRPVFWEGRAGWILVVLMVVAGVAGIVFSYNNNSDGPRGSIDIRNAERPDFYSDPSGWLESVLLEGPRSPVDGSPLVEGGSFEYFAVMIDNYSVARPAASIDMAPLVIESPVEGGITRLLALFLNGTEQDRIGPVRSARPYFVEWAEEYGSVLAHVGGSPAALDRLAETDDLYSLNEMQLGGYYWRDKQRDAPHNVFTSSDLLQASLEKMGGDTRQYGNDRPFKQGGLDGKPPGEPVTADILIGYFLPDYGVTWVYDENRNVYLRHQGGEQVMTEAGNAVSADNVIVQYTDMKVLDHVGRKEVRTDGAGEALVFRDGRVIKAGWSKKSGGRTRFLFPESDDEVPLNVGTTWLQVVADDTPLEY